MARSTVVLLLALAACSEDRPRGPPVPAGDQRAAGDADAGADADGADAAGDPDARPRFAVCDEAPLPSGLATEGWRHTASEITVLGAPGHSAQDVIAVTAQDTALPGKFAYGALSKDLEDEWIEVWIDRCTGAHELVGRALTDPDGRIALPLASSAVPPTGAYALYFRVVGDNTHTRSTLRVLPPGTVLTVFDIDGTLTTDDLELVQDIFVDLFDPILAGDYVPAARAGGIAATAERGVRQGFVIVYLTGRPYTLTARSRTWLADLGAAPGSLHLMDSLADASPSTSGVGDAKAAYLQALVSLGLTITYAYGNATTDIYAYAEAGVPAAQTFILGSHGGEQGTVDLGDDYQAHLVTLAGEAPISQPFVW